MFFFINKFIFIFLVFIFSSFIYSFDDTRTNYNIWLANAEFLMEDPQTYNKALDAVNKAMTYVPDGTEAKIIKDKILLAIKKEEEEKLRLKALKEPKIELDESIGSDLVSQGYAFALKQEYDRAVDYLTRALKENPSSFEALVNLGFVYEKLGRFDRSEDAYRKALQIRPNSAIVRNNLGYLYSKLLEPQKALIECELAVKLEPDNPSFLDSLAYAQIVAEKYDVARKTLSDAKKALNGKPVTPMMKFHEGILELNNRNYDVALTKMNEAAELFPDSYEINANLSIVYMSVEKGKESYESAQKALAVVPDSPSMNFHMGLLEMFRNTPVQALEHFKKSADKGKDTAEGYAALAMARQLELQMGSIASSTEQIDYIIKNFNEAILKRPTWWVPHFFLGQLCIGAGKNELAIEQLNITLKYVPEAIRGKVEELIASINNQESGNFYTSQSGRFRIFQPESPWQVTEDGSRWGINNASCVFYSGSDSLIAIIVSPNTTGEDARTIIEGKIAQLSMDSQGFKLINNQIYKVANVDAYEIIYNDGPYQRFLQTFFVKHNLVVCIAAFSGSHDLFDQNYEKIYSKVIRSFEFLE